MEKKIGKISSVRFGHVGYQDAQLGISFAFSGNGWGVSDSKAFWDSEIIDSKDCKWNENDRNLGYANVMRYISTLLKDAKCSDVVELYGKPVEVTFDGNLLKDWRILTEAL